MTTSRTIAIALCGSLVIAVQAQPLLARYNFNGNAQDISGHGHHADVHATSAPYGPGVYGEFDLALHLNGTEYLTFPSLAAPFREQLHEMTIAFFVRLDGDALSPVQDQTLLSLGAPGESLVTDQFTLRFEGGELELLTETNGLGPDHELTLDASMENGRWYHLALVLEGNELRYYRDGQLQLTRDYVPAETTCSALAVGALFPGTASSCCFLHGSIDDLRFYSTVLNSDQVAELAPVGIAELPGLVLSSGPNPADAAVEVALDRNGTALEVLDAAGRIVETRSALPQRVRIDVSDRPNGWYLLRFRTAEGVKTLRLAVQH